MGPPVGANLASRLSGALPDAMALTPSVASDRCNMRSVSIASGRASDRRDARSVPLGGAAGEGVSTLMMRDVEDDVAADRSAKRERRHRRGEIGELS